MNSFGVRFLSHFVPKFIKKRVPNTSKNCPPAPSKLLPMSHLFLRGLLGSLGALGVTITINSLTFRGLLGPSWDCLGTLLGASGSLLGLSWALLGFLGLSWGCLGPPWGRKTAQSTPRAGVTPKSLKSSPLPHRSSIFVSS